MPVGPFCARLNLLCVFSFSSFPSSFPLLSLLLFILLLSSSFLLLLPLFPPLPPFVWDSLTQARVALDFLLPLLPGAGITAVHSHVWLYTFPFLCLCISGFMLKHKRVYSWCVESRCAWHWKRANCYYGACFVTKSFKYLVCIKFPRICFVFRLVT